MDSSMGDSRHSQSGWGGVITMCNITITVNTIIGMVLNKKMVNSLQNQ